MPFDIDDFFAVFARYNEAIWPTQLIAYIAAALAVAALMTPSLLIWRTRIITAVLAAMWVINGIGYHWIFFSPVNQAAWVFGAVFLIQAAALAGSTHLFPRLQFRIQRAQASILGLFLIAFATIAYPIWGWAAGHVYPAFPVFGVAPCPTTIFTIGILLLGTWSAARWLLIVPSVWAAIGGSAAILLNVPQDYGLILAFLIVVAVAFQRWLNPPR